MTPFRSLRHYRLTADHVVELYPVESEADLIAWAEEVWGDDAGRRVDETFIDEGLRVSTVFLGLDHGFGRKGPPLVFETMIFDDYGTGDCWRWSTWDDAVEGHKSAVASLERAAKSARKRALERVDTKKAPD